MIIFSAAAGVRGVGAASVEITGLQRHVVPEDTGEAREKEEPCHGGWHPVTVTEILKPQSWEAKTSRTAKGTKDVCYTSTSSYLFSVQFLKALAEDQKILKIVIRS